MRNERRACGLTGNRSVASSFGRVRQAGFALLATFDHPHFTLVLADLSELARAGFVVEVGRYAVVGDDDADPKVARIVEISSDGNLLLEVLPGPVEAHRDVLARA